MERRKEKRGWTGIDCVLFGRPLPAANYDRFRYWKQDHGGGLAPRGPEKHFASSPEFVGEIRFREFAKLVI